MSRISYIFDSGPCEIQLESDIDVLQRVERRTIAKYGNTRSLRYKCFGNIIENRVVRKVNELFYIRLRKFGTLNNPRDLRHTRHNGVNKFFQKLWNTHKNIIRNKIALKTNRLKMNPKQTTDKQHSTANTKAACEKSPIFNTNNQTTDELLAIRRVGSTPKRPGVPQMGYLHRSKPSWAQQLLTKKHAFNSDDNVLQANISQSPDNIKNSPFSDCTSEVECKEPTKVIVMVDVVSDAKDAHEKSVPLRNTKLKRLRRACSKWTLQRLKLSGLIR